MTLFSDLGLNPEILKAIEELGFTEPTPVQAQSIPAILSDDKDILALAQTGTGKTAAFGLPILNLIDLSKKTTQALIICPTRELCLQIERDLNKFAKFIPQFSSVAVYGGSDMMRQIKSLRNKPSVIVATPGRLMDLMQRGEINFGAIRFCVLDEADEMLNMGFRDDIEYILGYTPAEKRTFLFSATMPASVRQIAERFLKDAKEISVGSKNTTNQNITHAYALVHGKDKFMALRRILDYHQTDFYGIIFCTTKRETQDIADKLNKDGYLSDCLHGDLNQNQRERVMQKFRQRQVRILLATDVAARGIDVKELTHVIHFDLPDDIENYTHRSGRTARAGKTGVSWALISAREVHVMRQIERMAKVTFVLKPIPTFSEVATHLIDSKIQQIFAHPHIEEAIEVAINAALADITLPDSDTLMRQMLHFLFSGKTIIGADREDLNRGNEKGGSGQNDPNRVLDVVAGTRLFINLGKRDGFTAASMKTFVMSNTGITPAMLKNVDIKGVYSYLTVKDEAVEPMMSMLPGSTFNGREIRMEKSGMDAKMDGDDSSFSSRPRSRRPSSGGSSRSFGSGYFESGDFKGSRSSGDRPERSERRGSGERSERSDRGGERGERAPFERRERSGGSSSSSRGGSSRPGSSSRGGDSKFGGASRSSGDRDSRGGSGSSYRGGPKKDGARSSAGSSSYKGKKDGPKKRY
jgi:ATP-dependent RNA helicase DeaD